MADLLPPGGVSSQVRYSTSEAASAGAGARRGGSVLGLMLRVEAVRGGGDSSGGSGGVMVHGRGDGGDGGDHRGRRLRGHG